MAGCVHVPLPLPGSVLPFHQDVLLLLSCSQLRRQAPIIDDIENQVGASPEMTQGGELGGSEYSLRFDSLRTICREIQVCSPSIYDIRVLCNYCVFPANFAQPSMQGLEAKKCEKHELIS
jgi:hypothetical protein